jgi:hypothetical protein
MKAAFYEPRRRGLGRNLSTDTLVSNFYYEEKKFCCLTHLKPGMAWAHLDIYS